MAYFMCASDRDVLASLDACLTDLSATLASLDRWSVKITAAGNC
jgi:hypothetical protein